MKLIKGLTFITELALLSVSCNQKHNIEAIISGLGNDTILIEYLPVSQFYELDEPYRDTIFSNDGKFYYNNPVEEPIALFVFPQKASFEKASYSYHPRQKRIELVLKPDDKIKVNGELKQYYLDYELIGSKLNEQNSKVRKEYIEETSEAVFVELQIDTLESNNGDNELISQLYQKRNKINQVSRTAQLEYIKDNKDQDLSAYYLTWQPLDTIGKYYSYLTTEVRNGLFKNMLESKFIKYRKFTKVREAELDVKEEAIAPNFTLKSLNGNDLTLNTIQANFIVLDFWGSWCGPCIIGFPRMKEYYEKYKSQVEFIGIACNDVEDKWKKAVRENNLLWPQVINTSDIDFDVSVSYGVRNYPTKFLLDKDRRIIAKFVGEGEDFYQKLDELMMKK